MGSSGGAGVVAPLLTELKKQASFFLKEKFRVARLVLTDVTPIQLLAEEVTKGNPASPNARTMGMISRAAFELEDYCRIVDILHARLERFDRAQWREAYNSMVLLEHLLTHGPASTAEEFQDDAAAIARIQSLQHVDERGFDWGLAAKKKSERVLQLLQNATLRREERERARKLSRGIQGFGRSASAPAAPAAPVEIPQEPHRRVLGLSKDHLKDDDDDDDDDEQETVKMKRYPGKENEVGKMISAADVSRPLLRQRNAVTELRKSDHPFGYMEINTACV